MSMTREQFDRLKVGSRIKVIGNRSGHEYLIGRVYAILRKSGARVYLKTDEQNGMGNPLSACYISQEDIDLATLTRNAEVKELMAENEACVAKIESNNARIAWLKTYKDNLDESLQKIAINLGISDKTLFKKLHAALKAEGIDPNFVKPSSVVAPIVPTLMGIPTVNAPCMTGTSGIGPTSYNNDDYYLNGEEDT